MQKTDEIITQYYKLRNYCDSFFEIVYSTFQSEMKCKKRCSLCCTLESVLVLEGSIITSYLEKHEPKSFLQKEDRCLFLDKGLCSIYPVRPIICRTHGLVLYDSEKSTLASSCDLNYVEFDFKKFNKKYALDIHEVTKVLVQLNLRYSELIDTSLSEDGRISLQTLVSK